MWVNNNGKMTDIFKQEINQENLQRLLHSPEPQRLTTKNTEPKI